MSLDGRTATAPALNVPAVEPRSASLSPSLQSQTSQVRDTAFEIKFLLTPEQVHEAQERLLHALLPDPHSDPALGGMYSITSLVCDGPDLGVFFRDEKMKDRKYRVRRYGGSATVYLERKQSRQGKVRKRRVEAPIGDLDAVASGRAAGVSHEWFLRGLRALDLAPVCRIRYLRRALFGACSDGPMRVTFDHAIRGSLVPAGGPWSLEPGGQERPLLEGFVVCEFKFQSSMPAPLKAVAAAMKLEATGVSKYRNCVRAFAGELGVDLSQAPAGAQGGAGVGRA
jgi:hypothetical protein